MDTFFDLNRDKLRLAFTTSSLLFLGVVSVFLVIAYFTKSFPGAELMIAILLTAGIIFPLFILLIAYLAWLHKRRARRRAFSKDPFNQIDNIGFYKSHSKVNSKWFFTEEVKEGKINGFTLVCDISDEKNHIIEIEVATQWKKIDKSEYNRISKKFKQYNIEFRIGSVVKQYDTSRPVVNTIHGLQEDLQQFTELLKQEGFGPLNHKAGHNMVFMK